MRRRLIPADLYHLLLTSSWPRLLGLLAIAYAAANALFALGYLIEPDAIENARPGSFADAFFFSVQTMATIGYGRMVPRTFLANTLVTLETLTGLLALAMITGLVFAKFSRPTARVLFSRVAVIGRRDGVRAFMFRMANERGNNIVEAQVHVALARQEVTAEGESVRRFYDLELARRLNPIFPNTWTVIHPIVDGGPLHHATATSLAVEDARIVVSVVGLDESYAQTVHARHSYGVQDIAWDARFVDIVTRDANGGLRIDYGQFHDVVPLESVATSVRPSRAS